MGLLDSVLCGIYAARISNRLIDLNVNVRKLDPTLARMLYEIERGRRGDLSPHEAAAYFVSANIGHIPQECYVMPLDRQDMCNRATVIINQWLQRGKVRAKFSEQIFTGLRASAWY